MVECKSDQKSDTASLESVLIDTWWNVNMYQLIHWENHISVLIDTWWNVNKDVFDRAYRSCDVLIDTWWNVNELRI